MVTRVPPAGPAAAGPCWGSGAAADRAAMRSRSREQRPLLRVLLARLDVRCNARQDCPETPLRACRDSAWKRQCRGESQWGSESWVTSQGDPEHRTGRRALSGSGPPGAAHAPVRVGCPKRLPTGLARRVPHRPSISERPPQAEGRPNHLSTAPSPRPRAIRVISSTAYSRPLRRVRLPTVTRPRRRL
jgi:hypothetical protein